MKKKVGPEGVEKSKIGRSEALNGQEMRNDLAITLCWGTLFHLNPWGEIKAKKIGDFSRFLGGPFDEEKPPFFNQ